MGQLADTFHLTVESPLYIVKRPRLWRLIFGAACFPLGFSLLWIESVNSYWSAMGLGNSHIYGLVLILTAALTVARSIAYDLLQVLEVSFDKSGMYLIWSHVPNLLSLRKIREKQFRWEELDSLIWHESDSEHDLQQHVKIFFKEEIGSRTSRLKLRISDDRNLDRCEKLIALLPEDFVVPQWIEVARKRRNQSTRLRGSVLENLPMQL
jgi:hypothetical protein